MRGREGVERRWEGRWSRAGQSQAARIREERRRRNRFVFEGWRCANHAFQHVKPSSRCLLGGLRFVPKASYMSGTLHVNNVFAIAIHDPTFLASRLSLQSGQVCQVAQKSTLVQCSSSSPWLMILSHLGASPQMSHPIAIEEKEHKSFTSSWQIDGNPPTAVQIFCGGDVWDGLPHRNWGHQVACLGRRGKTHLS